MADETKVTTQAGQDTQANAGAVPNGGKVPATASSQDLAAQDEPAL